MEGNKHLGTLFKMQFLTVLLGLGPKTVTSVGDATGPWSCPLSNKVADNTELRQLLSNDVTLNPCFQLPNGTIITNLSITRGVSEIMLVKC